MAFLVFVILNFSEFVIDFPSRDLKMGKRGFEVSHIEFDEVNLWMVMDEALKTLKKKRIYRQKSVRIGTISGSSRLGHINLN